MSELNYNVDPTWADSLRRMTKAQLIEELIRRQSDSQVDAQEIEAAGEREKAAAIYQRELLTRYRGVARQIGELLSVVIGIKEVLGIDCQIRQVVRVRHLPEYAAEVQLTLEAERMGEDPDYVLVSEDPEPTGNPLERAIQIIEERIRKVRDSLPEE